MTSVKIELADFITFLLENASVEEVLTEIKKSDKEELDNYLDTQFDDALNKIFNILIETIGVSRVLNKIAESALREADKDQIGATIGLLEKMKAKLEKGR